MNYFNNEREHYILDPQGEIDKEGLVEILVLAGLTVPDQFPSEFDPYQFADLIEPNLNRIDKKKIPPLVVTDLNLLEYNYWAHFRLVKLPKE